MLHKYRMFSKHICTDCHQLKWQRFVNVNLYSSNTSIEECKYAGIWCDVIWCDMIIWKYKKRFWCYKKKQVTLNIGQINNTNKYMPCVFVYQICTYALVNSKYNKIRPLENHTMKNKWPYVYVNGRMHKISHADNEIWTSDITIQQMLLWFMYL